jgi:peptide/nickel transport system substrate-binding protein
LQLEAFKDYWDGQPRLNRFSLYTYSKPEILLRGLTSHEINAATNLALSDSKKLPPKEFNFHEIALNSGVYAIFRTDNEILKEVKVRQALVKGIDMAALRRQLEVKPLDSPIVNNQLPLATKVKQISYDARSAEVLLSENGWVKNRKTGYLEKNAKPFELKLVTVDAGNYRQIAELLTEQWKKLGIKLVVQIVDPETVQQSVLRPRAYDILIYALELGGDADSYAYWHSSQSVGAGLNLANYSSPIADDALSTARIRSNIQLRDAKYATFAKQWVNDAPALSLYQPTLNYITSRNVVSLNNKDRLPTPSDRFSAVNQWSVQQMFTPTSP